MTLNINRKFDGSHSMYAGKALYFFVFQEASLWKIGELQAVEKAVQQDRFYCELGKCPGGPQQPPGEISKSGRTRKGGQSFAQTK